MKTKTKTFFLIERKCGENAKYFIFHFKIVIKHLCPDFVMFYYYVFFIMIFIMFPASHEPIRLIQNELRTERPSVIHQYPLQIGQF